MTDGVTVTAAAMLTLALGLGATWAIVEGGPRVARWTEGLIRFTARAAVRVLHGRISDASPGSRARSVHTTTGKGTAVSEFMDRARAEAEGRWPGCALHRDCEHQMHNEHQERERFLVGVDWAARQRPTEAEIEAAARKLYEILGGTDWEEEDRANRTADRAIAWKILATAQKVRAGQ